MQQVYRRRRKGFDWDAEVLKELKAAVISGEKKSSETLRDEFLLKYPDKIPAMRTFRAKIKQIKEEALKEEEAQAKALADAAAEGAEEHKPET